MLALYSRRGLSVEPPADLAGAQIPAEVVWIDLISPDPAEIAFVEKVAKLAVPSLHELSEIENSSRLRAEKGALYVNAPLIYRAESDEPIATPVGFVLTADRLITVRFAELSSFAAVTNRKLASEAPELSSSAVFSDLMDAIVDRLADVLERIAAELDVLSRRLFHAGPTGPSRQRRSTMESLSLRVLLRRVGRNGDLVSKIRDSLLGIARIIPFVLSLAVEWLPADVKPRLETVRQDVTSLNDYDAHLANKVQLLLDATLGMINIEQNNIIKVLAVVSVVGIPPTLVASMYGMNFRHMPELEWAWGYPYGLAVIAASAIVPLLWFKWRRWF
jgi:magnesium transporter